MGAVFSSVSNSFLLVDRIGYVAAREGHLPEFLCLIHGRRQTPAPAVVAQVTLSMIYFYIGGSSDTLIDMYAFFSWLAYGITMTTVFVFRKKFPGANRSFRVPSVIPVIIMVLSCYLFVVSILEGKPHIIFTTIVCISLTTIMYYIFIYKALRFKFIGRLQMKLQKMLGLVLPTGEPTY